MVLEHAVLEVKPGHGAEFERAFAVAEPIMNRAKGHISHDLLRCMEQEDRYLLLVEWETLEDHTEGFRGAPEYEEWRGLLHHFYDPFPEVDHYEALGA